MAPAELRAHLQRLNLTQGDAARLLGTTPRTVRRWLEPEPSAGGAASATIPGPVEAALRAWLRLHRAGLAWRVDEVAIGDPEVGEVDAFAALDVETIVERVRARGGPAAPWDVDLARGRATLGGLSLSFHQPAKGGFTPLSYRRRDGEPNPRRDAPLLEDAVACIARALTREGYPATAAMRLARPTRMGDRVLLWDDRPAPRAVLVVPQAVLRGVLGAERTAGELLVWVDRQRPALALWAGQQLDNATPNALGVRELPVDESVLRAGLDAGGASRELNDP